MHWFTRGSSWACVLAAWIGIQGCGGTGLNHENTGKKGPQMSLEKIKFYEAEKDQIRWEGRVQRAEAEEIRGRIALSGIQFSLTGEGGQMWFVEGETGFWDPEAKKITSDDLVRIHGSGVVVEGKGFDMDLTTQSAFLGENVSATIEGFRLEQK